MNEKLHALVSGNLPGRRANMSTEYAFATPGCLYDLDLRGAGNDQLGVPPRQQVGALLVRVSSDGKDGSPAWKLCALPPGQRPLCPPRVPLGPWLGTCW
jgi:hypothetical protein